MKEYFKVYEKKIQERSQRIKNSKVELCEHLVEDENLNVTFGFNRSKQAEEIQQEIIDLIEYNDFDKELLSKKKHMIQKYNLNVQHFPDLESFDLEKAEELVREKLALMIAKEGIGFEGKDEIEMLIGRIEMAKEEIDEFYATFWDQYYGIIGHSVTESCIVINT